MLVVFTPLPKSTGDRVLPWTLKCTTEQLKSLCCQMQNLKLGRQHSPPHKPCLADCPQEFLLLPQDHTPPGRGPSSCTQFTTKQKNLQLFLRKTRSNSTLPVLQKPSVPAVTVLPGGGDGEQGLVQVARGCSQLLGLLLPS